MKRNWIIAIVAVALVVVVVSAFLGRRDAIMQEMTNKEISNVLERTHSIKKPQGRKVIGKIALNASGSPNWNNGMPQNSKDLLNECKRMLDSGDEDKAIDAVQNAEKLNADDLIELAGYVLKTQSKTPSLRWDILDMVGKLSTKNVLPLLQQAMNDDDELVRSTAINVLTQFNDNRQEFLNELSAKKELTAEEKELLDKEILTNDDLRSISNLLTVAMADKDQSVVDTATKTMAQLHGDLQIISMETALRSDNPAVRKELLDIIAVNGNKDTIQLAINALKYNDEETFTRAQEVLANFLDQKFNSANDAQRWWQNNQNKYDYDLIQINMNSEE